MIVGINESKILTKHISFEPKCRFDGSKCNSDQQWNNDRRWCESKKHHVCEKDYIWNLATCSCENGKYLASIMDNSSIICDEVMESFDGETRTIPTNFNKRKVTWKMQNFYILLTLL